MSVGLDDRVILKGAFVAYIFPVLLMLLATLLGQWAMRVTGWGEELSIVVAAVGL